MNICKRIATLSLVAALALGLAACGGGVTKGDATVYIQGELDAAYLGQYNADYLKLMDLTEEEAAEDYQWNLEGEAEWFMDFAKIYATTHAQEATIALFEEIYAQSSYTVQPANKLENGNFAVEVLVKPMDIMVRFQEQADLDQFWSDVLAAAGITTEEEIDAMPDAEYEVLENQYADRVIGGIHELISDMGYEKEQSCIIQLKLTDDVYEMVGTDWQNLDVMIIDYYGTYAG